jgi:adenine-specific DNA methylase
MKEAVRKIATNTIGYTRKQAGKVWFDEECEKVNQEKNACRVNAIHRVTRAAQDKYRQARSIERNLFKKKSRQLDEEVLIEIERQRSIQDSRKFYKRLNDVRDR